MRKLTSLFILCFLLSFGKVTAQEKSSVQEEKSSYTEEYDKFRFGGYGEMAASYKDYDFNRFKHSSGSPKRNRGEISIPRFVLAFDYKFSPKWILGLEIEFEYGGTGVAREIEWFEENGEYETEIEKGSSRTVPHYTSHQQIYQCSFRTYDFTGRTNKYTSRTYQFLRSIPSGRRNNHLTVNLA